jgi:hypothetical protein
LLVWAVLLFCTALIHSYLLPMVAGLWAADRLARATEPAGQHLDLLVGEMLLVPASGILGLWTAGFFLLGVGFGGSWGGFGRMQLDLLAPFNPSFWGAFLPKLPGPSHLEVGNSYAGLGSLLLLLLGALAWALRPWPFWRARWPLLLMLGAMSAFAVTNRVSVGGAVMRAYAAPTKG